MEVKTVKLNEVVKCDFCGKTANYDGKTAHGWAYMCNEHFIENGIGVGLGKGQKIEYTCNLVHKS